MNDIQKHPMHIFITCILKKFKYFCTDIVSEDYENCKTLSFGLSVFGTKLLTCLFPSLSKTVARLS